MAVDFFMNSYSVRKMIFVFDNFDMCEVKVKLYFVMEVTEIKRIYLNCL